LSLWRAQRQRRRFPPPTPHEEFQLPPSSAPPIRAALATRILFGTLRRQICFPAMAEPPGDAPLTAAGNIQVSRRLALVAGTVTASWPPLDHDPFLPPSCSRSSSSTRRRRRLSRDRLPGAGVGPTPRSRPRPAPNRQRGPVMSMPRTRTARSYTSGSAWRRSTGPGLRSSPPLMYVPRFSV
jgi:hypothetical protein